MSEQTNQQTITLTLKRPLTSTDYTEVAKVAGPVLPAGMVLVLDSIDPYTLVVSDDPYPYGEVDSIDVLKAAAEEPCEHFTTDQGEEGPAYFECHAHYVENYPLLCMGDKKKCPFSEVRAETKEGDTNG